MVYADDSITPRIEEITGISQEKIDNASRGSEVFADFYDKLSEDADVSRIILYGNGDVEFSTTHLMSTLIPQGIRMK